MQASIRTICFGCLAFFAFACGSKGDDENEGSSGSGGSSGGNTAGSGGSTAGSGGSTAGMGGSASGSGGGAGAAPITKSYSFDTEADLDGWSVVFSNGPEGMEDNWIPKDEIMLAWAETGGDPDGALQVDIPYDGPDQWVTIGVNFDTADLTGTTITARVKLVSGLGEAADLMSAPGGAKLYAKSGMNYSYVNGMIYPINAVDQWVTVRFNVAAPVFEDPNAIDPFDAADVREIGIQFDTSSTSTTAMPATFLVDNLQY